jgi:hypothetical protein
MHAMQLAFAQQVITYPDGQLKVEHALPFAILSLEVATNKIIPGAQARFKLTNGTPSPYALAILSMNLSAIAGFSSQAGLQTVIENLLNEQEFPVRSQ